MNIAVLLESRFGEVELGMYLGGPHGFQNVEVDEYRPAKHRLGLALFDHFGINPGWKNLPDCPRCQSPMRADIDRSRLLVIMSSTKNKYYKYTQENLNNALDAIKSGLPCATAAKKYNVPRTTLIGKIKGIYPENCRSGVSTILNPEEEELLEKWIINMGKLGFPVTKSQLTDSVALLVKNLKRPNNFADGRPGRHWFEGFLRRHPQITERVTQNLSTSRGAVTKPKIEKWFEEIDDFFKSSKINIVDPRRIFNTDESALFLSPKGNKVLVKKGSKTVYDRSGDDKECLTVLITVLKTTLDAITDLESIFKNSFRVCGLLPFNCSNVDYGKLLPSSELMDSTENKLTENADIVNHLKFFEKFIDPTVLGEFYDLRGGAWTGNEENRNLYYTWLKIFKGSGSHFETGVEKPSSLVIEFEDGFVLETGWENFLVSGSEIAAEDERSPLNDITAKNNNDYSSHENHMLEKENDQTNIEKYMPEMDKDQIHIENHVTPEKPLEQLSTVTEDSNILLHHITPEKKNTKDSDKICSQQNIENRISTVLPGVIVPSPFKNSMFWPNPSTSKKIKRKMNVKVPSVGTSDAWREYHLKKEEAKAKAETAKNENKRKREETKKNKRM
ncbi:hypothetical protein MML48_9g00011248 [Holotrichia oblita]|uniref:Uncharacterized protein n=1 Tax=Holotrichia oblita TaxID=644536 RepID=A0ACB9SGW7_HOLOL|nr:hypothetical protein MML48_9g00011248 [Holotrichia oblita]